ncbi:HprK-related kinase A [Paraglaciecola sp.]|uniref:HprK-related kinase A n=1 Tax=Paraglaciecola sp. TaxID=1920173 RepID=UPI00273D4241|nr:HprK-related kinase A [Paraglaciecola sp.]MDP5031774.1 HprK-related kinase A [Paraglaciecola sp.]
MGPLNKLVIPPFCFEVQTNIPLVLENLSNIYGQQFKKTNQLTDFIVRAERSGGIRRFIKPQARFFSDQQEPFQPLRLQQAYAMLEWGMNWCVATHEMQYVIIHSAVLAKDNKAILFPAPPGSGKSTLTAYLAFNGWRLLSDEMALIIPRTKTVQPFVRPICLKNRSIDLAKEWFPNAVFSSVATDTHKGDVIHLSPPLESWQAANIPAEIVGVVFPHYTPAKVLDIYQLNQTQSFMQLAENAFNYGVIGNEGFETLTAIIEQVPGFEIFYNNVNEVAKFLEQELL